MKVGSALLLHGVSINPVWTSVNSGVIIQAVKENLGISVLPREKVRREIEIGQISEIKIDNLELKSINHIIFHKDKYQTKTMLKIMRMTKNEIPEDKLPLFEHIVQTYKRNASGYMNKTEVVGGPGMIRSANPSHLNTLISPCRKAGTIYKYLWKNSRFESR